jgi:iron complex outermembrane receptor protein
MKICRGCLIIILIFLSNQLLFAQEIRQGSSGSGRIRSNLTGKITDAVTGEPLDGASVYFSDIKAGGVSNTAGMYKLQNFPSGRYLIEVSHLGYASVIEQVELRGDQVRDFQLRPSIVENDEVTVTGVSNATMVRRSPIPVHIIKKHDLFATSSTNLIDALSRTPGVSQISTGPAISKPVIRGLGYNRLIVVNDGMRQEGQQWGDEHGIEIDEYSVSKIEVLKGPASLMYGSDALAGVINIISNVPVPEGTVKGNLFSNYQSNNGLMGYHANIAGNKQGFNWNFYGTYKSAHDYRNKYDGYVFNSRFNEKNLGGYIGLNKSWGYSHLLLSHFNQQVGLIEGERHAVTGRFLKMINNGGVEEEQEVPESDYKSRDPYLPRQHIRHFKASVDNHFNIGQNHLSVNIGFQRNQRIESGNVLDPSEKELFFDLHTVSYNVQYHFTEKNNWQTTIGINGMRQLNFNKGVEALIPEYRTFDAGAFLFLRKTFDALTLSGGLRFDNRSLSAEQLYDGGDIKFAQFSRSFSNVSGSVGLSRLIGEDVTLKFNLAKGFRAPTIAELSSNGAHEGTIRYEYGDRQLKSETSLQADAGIDAGSEHVSFSASLFYNSIRNFIYYRKLLSFTGSDSMIVHNGQEHFAFRFSQADAHLYGAEFNVDIHPHPLDWLHVENTFTYVRGKLNVALEGNRNLPFIPAPRLVNQVSADFFKKGNSVRNVKLSVELDNTFAQDHPFTAYNTETATAGYSLLNASVGGDIIVRNKTLFSLHFSANNITDKAWQHHLSRLKYAPVNPPTGRRGVFNMGRNFGVKVSVPLSFKELDN